MQHSASNKHGVDTEHIREVSVPKLANKGLGMTVTGSSNRAAPLYVAEVRPDGSAAQVGGIHPGDRIVGINDRDTHLIKSGWFSREDWSLPSSLGSSISSHPSIPPFPPPPLPSHS